MADNTTAILNPDKAAALLAKDHKLRPVLMGGLIGFEFLSSTKEDADRFAHDAKAWDDRGLEANTSKYSFFRTRCMDIVKGKRPPVPESLVRRVSRKAA